MVIDPIFEKIEAARAAESALAVALAENEDAGGIAGNAAEEALKAAYDTIPTTIAGVAALGQLLIDIEGEVVIEPIVLRAISDDGLRRNAPRCILTAIRLQGSFTDSPNTAARRSRRAEFSSPDCSVSALVPQYSL